jgi:hypothetical protein
MDTIDSIRRCRGGSDGEVEWESLMRQHECDSMDLLELQVQRGSNRSLIGEACKAHKNELFMCTWAMP